MKNQIAPFFGAVLKAIACTPNQNQDVQAYNTGVIGPAREIRKLDEETSGRELTADQIQRVLDLLIQIMQTKQVDREEQADRIREVLDRANLHEQFGHMLERVKNGAT